jgi:acyl-homoserine-lactone acylase
MAEEADERWADGLNWYLASHPQVQAEAADPLRAVDGAVFSEGSIGGDIERST